MSTHDEVVSDFLMTGDACPCPAMPVNYWRLPDDTWVAARTIAADTGGPDAAEYLANGCTAWVIACPECRTIYAGGQTP